MCVCMCVYLYIRTCFFFSSLFLRTLNADMTWWLFVLAFYFPSFLLEWRSDLLLIGILLSFFLTLIFCLKFSSMKWERKTNENDAKTQVRIQHKIKWEKIANSCSCGLRGDTWRVLSGYMKQRGRQVSEKEWREVAGQHETKQWMCGWHRKEDL